MTNTAERNVTEAADMAEIAERTTNLKQWETEHEEHEHKLVKDQLARLADADDKNAALNRISMQANQLNQEKVALENLAKLKAETKKIRDSQKAEAKNTEAPLPKVPEEYQAPATQDGKEDISNSNVVNALNAKIESAQQKIAEATREQDAVPVPDSKKPTSTALPKSLQNKMNTVKDGIQSIDEVTGTP